VKPPPAAYKVVEVSPVSEETLERALNDWTREGWGFESLHSVLREGSHRPALAYVFFVQGASPGGAA
jgi:type 1 glutamine amidotransferase